MTRLAPTPDPLPTERQQRIDEIKLLLAEAGFTAKDMFLTMELVAQMAAPDQAKHPGAWALWWERESRRRQIFRRMTSFGLTAHDLAPRGRTTPLTRALRRMPPSSPTYGEPGLSRRDIARLAEDYTERAYVNAQETGGDTRTAELDAELRRRLAEMVLPEFIEVEFQRVLDAVFKV